MGAEHWKHRFEFWWGDLVNITIWLRWQTRSGKGQSWAERQKWKQQSCEYELELPLTQAKSFLALMDPSDATAIHTFAQWPHRSASLARQDDRQSSPYNAEFPTHQYVYQHQCWYRCWCVGNSLSWVVWNKQHRICELCAVLLLWIHRWAKGKARLFFVEFVINLEMPASTLWTPLCFLCSDSLQAVRLWHCDCEHCFFSLL